MGAFTSRQNAAVEEAEQSANNAYKYPPRSGNFFGSHFIMGGERFDTPQPESYLFGENADLNFLGNRPTAFPYPPPAANEPTKTLKSLVNIRKESVRFVRVAPEKKADSDTLPLDANTEGNQPPPAACYNIEFTFDSDAKCAITIYYFCSEDVSPSGITLTPREGLISETYHYDKGINQYFSQPEHIFNPQLIPEDDFIYNASKEQYPVAIHCVVEEGNEECRQSHTTICVIDHHADSSSYVLRALKQKIFVDGLCYLLQEIYGIENKAINKSSIDEEIDDHGSECVICMSETRDTLILPCRHLCLCNSCADSLRYQANNCPICRAPFRALLQIRAVQKGVTNTAHNLLHQNSATGSNSEQAACDQHLPVGYIPVSLIEALNGPAQYVGRVRTHDRSDMTDGNSNHSSIMPVMDNKQINTPHKSQSGHRSSSRSGKKKHTTNHGQSMEMNTLSGSGGGLSVVEIAPTKQQNPSPTLAASLNELSSNNQDKLQIVNERASLGKVSQSQKIENHVEDDDDDSENEKLSPLLIPQSKSISGLGAPSAGAAQSLNSESLKTHSISNDEGHEADEHNNNHDDEDDDDDDIEHLNLGSMEECIKKETDGDSQMDFESEPSASNRNCASLHRNSLKYAQQLRKHKSEGGNIKPDLVVKQLDEIDYYSMKDVTPRAKSATIASSGAEQRGGSLKHNIGSFKSASNLMKKTLHKKSTSVGNMPGSMGSNTLTLVGTKTDVKGNVNSLPDMLDSPVSGNSASTRSSSDSYSSSSSTKQLLSTTPLNVAAATTTTTTSNAANIVVDDKLALQNAVNV